MSWQNQNKEIVKSRGACKIRKRGCSSSSSSSLVQKYRFKPAILVGKRGGSSTPEPTWKTSTESSNLAMSRAEFPKSSPPEGISKAKEEVSKSARKLAATLWEINQIPSPRGKQDLEATRDKQDMRNRVKVSKLPQTLPSNLSDPSYSHISQRIDRSRDNGHRRTSTVSRKLQVTDYKLGGLDSVSNASMMEKLQIETHSTSRTHTGCVIGIKTRLKDVSNRLTTSKELLKVLNRVWCLEEQNSSSEPLVSALRVEIDRARLQVDQLMREQRSNRNEIEFIMKYYAEEKAAWKKRERDRIREAISCVAEELEVEKKLRRQTERLNKKLGKELADTKASLSNAMKELESEKRAKEILEQVCDELGRGLGGDRAQVEQIKRESAKAREEVEKEGEMLQLADVLRKEGVQMNLSEPKYHFEEKNAAVEKMRNELETYLTSKIGEENGDESLSSERIKELEAYLKHALSGSCQDAEIEEDKGEIADGEDYEGDDSADSDLHSIELNMENSSRSYQWSYACGDDARGDSKRASVDEEVTGRKSLSEKIQWGSICFGRGNSNDIDWNLDLKSQQNSDLSEKERSPELVSQIQTRDYEDEIKRYKSVKSLRDHILSSTTTIAQCKALQVQPDNGVNVCLSRILAM